MKRAEAGAAGDQLARPGAVVADERDDLVKDPRLIDAVAARALLERDARVRPRLVIEGVHAVQLDASRADQLSECRDHPPALELTGVAALGREGEHRPPPVSVGGHPVHRAGQTFASSPVRCGSNAARQLG
jgi:hypothetical protein